MTYNIYLDQYYEVNHIHEMVQYNTVVVNVSPADTEGWVVALDNGSILHFDAVAICNGHYGMPFVPAIVCTGFLSVLLMIAAWVAGFRSSIPRACYSFKEL